MQPSIANSLRSLTSIQNLLKPVNEDEDEDDVVLFRVEIVLGRAFDPLFFSSESDDVAVAVEVGGISSS